MKEGHFAIFSPQNNDFIIFIRKKVIKIKPIQKNTQKYNKTHKIPLPRNNQ